MEIIELRSNQIIFIVFFIINHKPQCWAGLVSMYPLDQNMKC